MNTMAKISQYTLKDGRSATRVSDVQESDNEVIKALISRFGDDVVSVKIEDRMIEIEKLQNAHDCKV